MTKDDILPGLAEILRDVFDDPDLVVTHETTADDIEEWDSLNHITIMVAAEERFGVKFKTAELERLRDVGELADLIATKLHLG
jgi:acyl carrier protein